MKKIFLPLLCIYTLVIVAIACNANQNFLYFEDSFVELVPKRAISKNTLLKEIPSNCEPLSQYRENPERTGVNLDATPKIKVKNIKHIYPLNVGIHGASKSSVAIDESGIYVGSDTGWFWKLSHEGQILWDFYISNAENGIHATPAVDNKKVYVGAYNGNIYALDKYTGDISWISPVGHFVGASPLIANKALYIAAETAHPNGLVAKLDCNTGEIQWISEWLGNHTHSSPLYDRTTDSILVGSNSGRVYSLDEKTGKTNWKRQIGGPIKGTLMLHEDRIYFSAWDKNYHALDTKNGNTSWSRFLSAKLQTSLALVPEKNLGITNTPFGKLVALDLNTGETTWEFKHADNDTLASVLVTPNKQKPGQYLAWARCRTINLCVLNAATGKLLHELMLPGPFTGVPVAFKDRIYITLVDNHGLVILE